MISEAEQARRKDISRANVAQEALNMLETLAVKRWSSSRAFTVHGYSLSHVCAPALEEEQRIIRELATKPVKDVESAILKVTDVKTKHNIPDYVAPAPEPV
ncbi:hypothetical protein LCGC14_2600740 [marine sediment metagenome]|uniref:Uncharacterized protein n=1 Tax=marine sediment metagenome TaxID=412755 RepID=A0A0F9AWI7_9ZZZZ